MTTDDVGAADRKKHAVHKRQPRRAIYGMGSVHVRELPAPNGGVYTYYRAVRRIKVGSKTVTVAVQRKTAADAARALEEAVTRKRVAYGQLGPEHLTVPEELSYVTVRDVMTMWLETKNDDGDLAWQSYRMYDSRIRQLEALHLFREWNVDLVTKKPRSRSPKLRDLTQSRWLNPETNRADRAADAANIFVGLRLKTDDRGSLMDEDTWAEVQAGGDKIAEAFEADDAESFERADHDLSDFSF